MGTVYRHLDLGERIAIEKGVEAGDSVRVIARRLGRAASTVSREIRRNPWRASNENASYRPYRDKRLRSGPLSQLRYRADMAERAADRRALNSHRPRVLSVNERVAHVVNKLRDGWTPQMIAGRLKAGIDGLGWSVSHETIYAWIYAPANKHRQLAQYLPHRHKTRRRKQGRRVGSVRIAFRESIRNRPAEVDSRAEFGHWEADTVMGSRETGDGIHTEVERYSRFMMAAKIPQVTSAQTIKTQLEMFTRLPAHAARSVTCDNGREFHQHYQLDQLAIPTYFADPYCSWQRGTNEHHNGRLRRYLPKKTDFSTVDDEELADIIAAINNQPRRCLGWYTPAEVFNELCSDQHTTTVALQI